jgi:hypothetical protein
MRRPYRLKSPCSERVQVGFLLAFDNRCRIKTCHHLRGVPKAFTNFQSTLATVIAHHTLVAIAEMGHRHHRTVNSSPRKLQIRSGGSRVFYQMDRGKTSSQYRSSGTQKIFLVKHNFPLCSAKKDNC